MQSLTLCGCSRTSTCMELFCFISFREDVWDYKGTLGKLWLYGREEQVLMHLCWCSRMQQLPIFLHWFFTHSTSPFPFCLTDCLRKTCNIWMKMVNSGLPMKAWKKPHGELYFHWSGCSPESHIGRSNRSTTLNMSFHVMWLPDDDIHCSTTATCEL